MTPPDLPKRPISFVTYEEKKRLPSWHDGVAKHLALVKDIQDITGL